MTDQDALLALAEPMKAIVVVHFDEHGELSYHVCGGEAVRVLIVDERAQHDRVYEWTPRCGPDEIRAIIPEGSDIGSSQDERHAAIANAVEAYQDGRPRLALVEDKEP